MINDIVASILMIAAFFMGMLMTVLVLKIAVLDSKNGRRCAAWILRRIDKWEHTRNKRIYRQAHRKNSSKDA